jgi:hypothetical protein
MEFTWGFLLLFTVFIFPGLIIRRLYFFGEFSKQFGYNDPLLKTLAYALVPGLINAIAAFLIYDGVFGGIDLDRILDAYKELANEDPPNGPSRIVSLNKDFKAEVLPFLGLLYMLACMIGAISGQAVRWTGIDTKFKILRFKNQWFYLFTGNHRRFRKFQPHVKDANRFLFLVIDIMVEAGGKTKLYSGTLVDYELDPNDCHELSKVVLKDAHRYAECDNGTLAKKPIPGNLFVLDCSNLVNINLTHVYESDEARVVRDRSFRQSWNNWTVVITILLLPFMYFRIDAINYGWYAALMEMTWVGKFFAWMAAGQLVQMFNYVVQDKRTKEYRKATAREWALKLVMLPVLFVFTLGVDRFAHWMLSWFN